MIAEAYNDLVFWETLTGVLQFVIPAGVILLGYLTGRHIERAHFRRILHWSHKR